MKPDGPEPAPPWLVRLFPHTGKPGRLDNRLRRMEATEIDVQGRRVGSVVAEIAYPGLDGQGQTGQVRLFLPLDLRDDPNRRVPLVHNAGYEIDPGAAASLAAKGYAVCTPHAHPLNPLGRGWHLDAAILHAVRRLPVIDPGRVGIQGGSAGGWMALMLCAETFPLLWAMPDVAPIHWGYNAAYIGEQEAIAGAPAGSDKPLLPVLHLVGVIAQQSKALYGVPFDSPAYLAASPLGHLDTMTAPILATFSTADMLVPIDQVGASLVKPRDAGLFPPGFRSAMTARFPGVRGGRTLLEALSVARYELFRLPSADSPTRLGPDGVPLGAPKPLPLPFSKERLWSIVVIDEGAQEPGVGHFKYAWSIHHDPFHQWAEQRGVLPDQLAAPKLERLMKRLLGEPWRPLHVRPGGRGPEIPGNALDYPEAERADVLLGLGAFAADDACARRLAARYARLPRKLQALGPRLGDGTPAGVRAALAALSAGAAIAP